MSCTLYMITMHPTGNDPDIITATLDIDDGLERKQMQQMGYTVASKNGVFVVSTAYMQCIMAIKIRYYIC